MFLCTLRVTHGYLDGTGIQTKSKCYMCRPKPRWRDQQRLQDGVFTGQDPVVLHLFTFMMMMTMSLLSAGMCKRLVCYALCVFFVASLATLVPSYFSSCQLTSRRFLTSKSVTEDRGLRGYEGDMFLWNVGNHYPAMQHHISGTIILSYTTVKTSKLVRINDRTSCRSLVMWSGNSSETVFMLVFVT